MKKIFLTFSVAVLLVNLVYAQNRKDQQPVTYEELYDEPYAINKLFVQFQPIYGELFVTNANAGFGLEVTYFLKDKAQFRAHGRKAYAAPFDFTRELANRTSDVVNTPRIFNFYELGGTYHIKDFEESSKTKMVLYRKSYKGNRWAARVPINAEIPSKVRKIYGARAGGFFYDSSVDINRALDAQDRTLADLIDSDGVPIPTMVNVDGEDSEINVFSGVNVQGLYLGGSMSWIRNVAVDFDKYEEGVDDLMLTLFLDFMIAPSITVDDIIYAENDPNNPGNTVRRTFAGSLIDSNMFGFRMGIDGKFNRTLSWAYGGEFGYRPGIAGQGFYALIKISFPVYSTNIDYGVEAFGK